MIAANQLATYYPYKRNVGGQLIYVAKTVAASLVWVLSDKKKFTLPPFTN